MIRKIFFCSFLAILFCMVFMTCASASDGAGSSGGSHGGGSVGNYVDPIELESDYVIPLGKRCIRSPKPYDLKCVKGLVCILGKCAKPSIKRDGIPVSSGYSAPASSSFNPGISIGDSGTSGGEKPPETPTHDATPVTP